MVSDRKEKRSFDKLRTSGGAEIAIGAGVFQSIIAHAARAAPQEACGLLLGVAGRIGRAEPAANIHPTPQTRFEIDPQALIDAHRSERAGGAAVLGYYHSHPAGPPEPSPTDTELAARDGRVWAIVGRVQARGGEDWGVRLWEDGEAGFAALSYSIVQG